MAGRRCAGKDKILAWEIINEPEWIFDGSVSGLEVLPKEMVGIKAFLMLLLLHPGHQIALPLNFPGGAQGLPGSTDCWHRGGPP